MSQVSNRDISKRGIFLFGIAIGTWVSIWTQFIPIDWFQFCFAYFWCAVAMGVASWDRT